MYRYTCEADDTCWQEKPPHKLGNGEARKVVMKKPRRSRAKTESSKQDELDHLPESDDDGNPQPPLALFIAPMPFAEHFAKMGSASS